MKYLPRSSRLRAVSLCVVAWVAHVWSGHSQSPAKCPAEAIIRFSGTSTLHDFGGEVPVQPFVLNLGSNSWSAEAEVLAALMNTASAGRDKNMYKMLNTNDHPRIHGTVTLAPLASKGATNATLRLKIRNQEHDLPVQISSWLDTTDRLSFHAEWDLSLKQFQLKPPSVIGIIRVGDNVHLNADVTARKTPALTNSAANSTVAPDKK